MKFYRILFIFKLILDLSQCDATTWECKYEEEKTIWAEIESPTSAQREYRCFLKSNHKDATEITAIQGYHEGRKSDVDITWISIENNLKKLTSTICDKFKNVKAIYVTNKKIESFEANALANCKNLEMIILTNNGLHEIPKKLFHKNINLTNVWITRNNLSQPLPENLYQNLNQVIKVILNENKIKFLPPKIFHPLRELHILSLVKNELTTINPEWFENLGNLFYLSLSGNKIKDLPTGAFKPLVNLEKLDLSKNFIENLNQSSFIDLPKLKTLYLESNFISDLPSGIFANLKNLKELNLGHNQLQSLHSDSFGSLNKLTKIHLDNNKINALDEKIFDKTTVIDISMWMNLCSNESIWSDNINKVKEKLKNCCKNYKPRQSNVCGLSRTAEGRTTDGNLVNRGSYPWIAVLKKTNGELFCGGTLVSNRKIVTAAHCVKDKSPGFTLLAQDIKVLLGAYDLSILNEDGRSEFGVQSINIHPDWDILAEKFDADISILTLDREVEFSQFIQPICIINQITNISGISDGIVVGFGKNKAERNNIARALSIPIADSEDCFLSDYFIAKFSSNRTFCGGYGNGTGICNGDNGSGLVISYKGVYYLRGIVSKSINNRAMRCDDESFSIFTDILKFNDFIN